jgi:hypothetical protein
MNKLNVKALGLAIGIVWASGVVFCIIFSIKTKICEEFVKIISSLYLGVDVSLKGAALGGVWAFLDGAFAGILIAIIYNFFARQKK